MGTVSRALINSEEMRGLDTAAKQREVRRRNTQSAWLDRRMMISRRMDRELKQTQSDIEMQRLSRMAYLENQKREVQMELGKIKKITTENFIDSPFSRSHAQFASRRSKVLVRERRSTAIATNISKLLEMTANKT